MRTPVTTLRPNALAQRITGRNYLSYSAVSLYQRCPLAYRFKYIDGLPEETVSASLVFGGGIHASLEHYFKRLMTGGEAPDHDTLLDVFWDAWRTWQNFLQEKRLRGGKMEGLFGLILLAAIGWWFYKSGKRHGRRRRR